MEEVEQNPSSPSPKEAKETVEKEKISSSSHKLQLFGSWANSYTHRIQLALKLKNLTFDYIEEDMSHKSPSLLLHNPIYQKVPVLVFSGRPIPESLIILHFLDEQFPSDLPQLLPKSPHDRAAARFWAHFADDRLSPAVAAVFASSGETQRAAVDRFRSELRLVEAELSNGAFAGRRFFSGEQIGFLDIVIGCGSYWLAVFEEVAEVKLVDADEFPRFHAWLRRFEEQEEVKAIIPPFDELLGYARSLREILLMGGAGEPASNVAGEPASNVAGV